MKRRKSTLMMDQNCHQLLAVDRLSSLPDAILVDILSLLPLGSAIVTDVLSKRWRHLWTQITSVVIDDRIFTFNYDMVTSIDQSIHKLTSPFLHTFLVDFQGTDAAKIPIASWLRRICQRQVRHLSVSLRAVAIENFRVHRSKLQASPCCCIFKTRSLVSIQLNSDIIHNNDDLFDLPNLKTLRVKATPSQCPWLNKLAESCPSLEDISVDFGGSYGGPIDANYSCPNLRRLSVDLGRNIHCKVVINAPKLEYLDSRFKQSSTTFCIRDKPIRLHESKIEVLGCFLGRLESFEAVSDVRILTINSFALNTLTTFSNLSRLTLNLDFYCKFEKVTSFLQRCPVLDVLTLLVSKRPAFKNSELWKIRDLHTLKRVKKIEIDICYIEFGIYRRFSEMIHYFLENCSVLERFCFRVSSRIRWESPIVKQIIAHYERSEHGLRDLLFKCPRASIDCEVLFTGKFSSMSRKAGPNILRVDGVGIPSK